MVLKVNKTLWVDLRRESSASLDVVLAEAVEHDALEQEHNMSKRESTETIIRAAACSRASLKYVGSS